MKRAIRSNFDLSPAAYGEYEARTGRFRGLARRLVREMADRSDGGFDRMLDAGAGTGASTGALAGRAASVVALDASRPMLLANDAPLRVRADLDRLPFRGATFDAVAFTASLFLVPDPAVAVREASRILRPAGVIGAVAPVGWGRPDGSDPFADLARESRSPRSPEDVGAALGPGSGVRTVGTGEWTFETTPENVRAFHRTPAGAARLYPDLPPAERVERADGLLADLSGPIRQQWRWFVAVPEDEEG